MKKFYYNITKSTRHKFGGWKQKAEVYTITKGSLVHCCAAEWSTGTWMGEKNEVFQALIKNGFIPKKYEDSSKSEYCGGGRFYGEVCKKYSIEQI